MAIYEDALGCKEEPSRVERHVRSFNGYGLKNIAVLP